MHWPELFTPVCLIGKFQNISLESNCHVAVYHVTVTAQKKLTTVVSSVL